MKPSCARLEPELQASIACNGHVKHWKLCKLNMQVIYNSLDAHGTAGQIPGHLAAGACSSAISIMAVGHCVPAAVPGSWPQQHCQSCGQPATVHISILRTRLDTL